ncbi:MAG: transposase [Halobacteriota archaeon]|uniref:transposase n=1 Tax=Natronomonas sp. TaxID=2184060 RepID=UPI0039753620
MAYYQSLLETRKGSSKRIDRLHRKRTNRRTHAQDSLIRNLMERRYDEDVSMSTWAVSKAFSRRTGLRL